MPTIEDLIGQLSALVLPTGGQPQTAIQEANAATRDAEVAALIKSIRTSGAELTALLGSLRDGHPLARYFQEQIAPVVVKPYPATDFRKEVALRLEHLDTTSNPTETKELSVLLDGNFREQLEASDRLYELYKSSHQTKKTVWITNVKSTIIARIQQYHLYDSFLTDDVNGLELVLPDDVDTPSVLNVTRKDVAPSIIKIHGNARRAYVRLADLALYQKYLSIEQVDVYRIKLQRGIPIKALEVGMAGSTLVLNDGYHRSRAAFEEGYDYVLATVRPNATIGDEEYHSWDQIVKIPESLFQELLKKDDDGPVILDHHPHSVIGDLKNISLDVANNTEISWKIFTDHFEQLFGSQVSVPDFIHVFEHQTGLSVSKLELKQLSPNSFETILHLNDKTNGENGRYTCKWEVTPEGKLIKTEQAHLDLVARGKRRAIQIQVNLLLFCQQAVKVESFRIEARNTARYAYRFLDGFHLDDKTLKTIKSKILEHAHLYNSSVDYAQIASAKSPLEITNAVILDTVSIRWMEFVGRILENSPFRFSIDQVVDIARRPGLIFLLAEQSYLLNINARNPAQIHKARESVLAARTQTEKAPLAGILGSPFLNLNEQIRNAIISYRPVLFRSPKVSSPIPDLAPLHQNGYTPLSGHFKTTDNKEVLVSIPDTEGVTLTDYRALEAKLITGLIDKSHPLVVVAGISGTGLSQAMIWNLERRLSEKGHRVVSLDLARMIRDLTPEKFRDCLLGIDSELFPSVIIADHIQVIKGPYKKVFSDFVAAFLERKGHHIVGVSTGINSPEDQIEQYRKKFEELETNFQAQVVIADPKLMNLTQLWRFLGLSRISYLSGSEKMSFLEAVVDRLPPLHIILENLRLHNRPDIHDYQSALRAIDEELDPDFWNKALSFYPTNPPEYIGLRASSEQSRYLLRLDELVPDSLAQKIIPTGQERIIKVSIDLEKLPKKNDEGLRQLLLQGGLPEDIKDNEVLILCVQSKNGIYHHLLADTFEKLGTYKNLQRILNPLDADQMAARFHFESGIDTRDVDAASGQVNINWITISLARELRSRGVTEHFFQNWIDNMRRYYPRAKIVAPMGNVMALKMFYGNLSTVQGYTLNDSGGRANIGGNQISEIFLDKLADFGYLTKEQSNWIKNQRDYLPHHLSYYFYQFLEKNRAQAVADGKSKATSDIDFLMEAIDAHPTEFLSSPYIGDISASGLLPIEAHMKAPSIHTTENELSLAVQEWVKKIKTLLGGPLKTYFEPGIEATFETALATYLGATDHTNESMKAAIVMQEMAKKMIQAGVHPATVSPFFRMGHTHQQHISYHFEPIEVEVLKNGEPAKARIDLVTPQEALSVLSGDLKSAVESYGRVVKNALVFVLSLAGEIAAVSVGEIHRSPLGKPQLKGLKTLSTHPDPKTSPYKRLSFALMLARLNYFTQHGLLDSLNKDHGLLSMVEGYVADSWKRLSHRDEPMMVSHDKQPYVTWTVGEALKAATAWKTKTRVIPETEMIPVDNSFNISTPDKMFEIVSAQPDSNFFTQTTNPLPPWVFSAQQIPVMR